MRRSFFLFVMLFAAQTSITHAQTKITVHAGEVGSDGAYDVESFAAQLEGLADSLEDEPTADDMAKVRSSLPKSWTVKAGENRYVISSKVVDQALAAGNADDATDWLYHMSAEARSYSAGEAKSNGNARAELDKILAGNEFAAVHPPSPWDLFRQRLAAWVNRLLDKIFGGIERYPIGGKILFWSVMIVTVGFIALWLFRFMVSRDRMDTLPAGEIVSASRTWQEWIRMAREAASRKDFREAVHSAYWAGIARLEDTGVVPKDRTKTPREYLRLVAAASENELAQRPLYRVPLGELTKRLELIWYANRGAGPEDFVETLKQLEAMGCQLE
jgi:hypothetical protein